MSKANEPSNTKSIAKGSFEAQLKRQDDARYEAGRMTINKTFSGDLEGVGKGQMISKRIPGGVSVYHAIEEVSGTLNGKTGGFTLIHSGRMDSSSQTLEIVILTGSGTGELKTIAGDMAIHQDDNGHRYELHYEL